MTTRERVLAVLNREKPDYVPWMGDLAYWVSWLLHENKMPSQYMTKSEQSDKIVNEGLASFTGEGLQQLHRDLGVGFYLQGYFPFSTNYDGLKVKEESTDKHRITNIETPYGNLEEVWQYSPESYSWAPVQHMLKTHNDIRAFKYLYESAYYEKDYKLAQERVDRVGDNGVNLAYLPKSPYMEMIAIRAGVENTIYMQLDALEEFDSLLDLMEEKHDQAAQIALDSPAECLMIPENISSEVVGKQKFERYMKRYQKKWIDSIRERGKYSFVHLDGTMRGLIRELSDTGFDVLEALTPSPVGDIEIEDLHNWVNPETTIWGGIPGGYFSDVISDSEFDEFVIRVLETMKKEPRYVLGVADQIVPGSRFERIARVNELVQKYGKYE